MGRRGVERDETYRCGYAHVAPALRQPILPPPKCQFIFAQALRLNLENLPGRIGKRRDEMMTTK